jgi:hypothetical protein
MDRSNSELYQLYKKTKLENQKEKYVELIEKNTANKIEKKFRELFGKFYDDFVYIFEKSECRISGSFVLQNLLGEFWENSDIDIFTHSIPKINFDYVYDWDDVNDWDDINEKPIKKKEKKEKNNKDINQCDESKSNIFDFLLYKLNCQIKKSCSDKYNNIAIQKKGDFHTDAIIDVNDTNINNQKLQLISIKKEVYLEKCIFDFDFDICKNICFVKNGQFYVKIYKIREVFDKKFKFSYNNSFKTIQRTEKYIKRGFNIIFDKEQIYKQLKSDLENEHKECKNDYPSYCSKAKRLISIHDTDIDLSQYNNKIYMMNYKFHTISQKKINLHDIDDDIINNLVIDSISDNLDKYKIDNIELCNNDCVLRLLDKTHFHYKSNLRMSALEHIFVQRDKQAQMIELNIDSTTQIEL